MIVAGNWKMNTDAAQAGSLAGRVAEWAKQHPGPVSIILSPPFPFLADVVRRVSAITGGGTKSGQVIVAAQNCHAGEQGAFTGEVSVPMLGSVGVAACIVGHSERRQYHGETDEAVGLKMASLIRHGLAPIYCCGERLEDREQGRHFEVVAGQLRAALGRFSAAELKDTVVAYEPVWAIGTGLTATPQQAQEMHAFLRKELGAMIGGAADGIPILYGGSCKASNAAGLFAQEDIDGGLIGGASLDADEFIRIVQAAGEAKS